MRKVRRIVLGGALLTTALAVVGMLYLARLSSVFHPIEWRTLDGGLYLHYVPGKDMVHLMVNATYVSGSDRAWVLVEPGASRRVFGRSSVPSPEALFRTAQILGSRSDPKALVRLYDDVGESQRRQIEGELQWLCEESPATRVELQKLLDEREHPWLAPIVNE